MFEFGDEILLGSFKIPWLIWIQLVVTFLLIFLLYYFSFIALDLPATQDSDIINPCSSTSSITNTSYFHHDKVGESRSIRGEIMTSTNRRIIRGSSENQQRSIVSSSSSKENTDDDDDDDATHFASSENPYHPCYYFKLAKQAFLKCFGLDIASECFSTTERHKKD